MTWAKFDDGYDDHPKVMAVTQTNPLAAALHPQAITASARRESDGLVDQFWLQAKIPSARKRQHALQTLVELGLFDVLPAGEQRQACDQKGWEVVLGPFEHDRYIVHDFLDFNDSSAYLADRRRRDAERKRGESNGTPRGSHPDSNGSPSASRARGSAGAGPRPDPTRPTEAKASGAELAKATPEQIALCDLLADLIRQRDPKAKVNPEAASWLKAMRLLLGDRDGDVADVERVLRWSQADSFWQSNILCPAKLREKFTQLRGRMEGGGLHAVRPPTPVADVVAEGDRLITEALERQAS